MVRYQINMVRNLRLQEKKSESVRLRIVGLTAVAVGAVVLAGFYTFINISSMLHAVEKERASLAAVEAEYRKYRETTMIVDKDDIELLDKLQKGRVFWTQKLAAMAYHLPNEAPNPYWITRFGYSKNTFKVNGFGYITPKQEQLITIDDYLNQLRVDKTYRDVFPTTFLNSTTRIDENSKARVNFEFVSMDKGAKKR